MTHPCCCSLKAGTRAVAILQIIGSILGIIFSVIALNLVKHQLDQQGKSMPAAVIIVFVIVPIYFVFSLILGAVLLQGANSRDLRKCKIWFHVTLVLTVIAVIFIVFSAFRRGGLKIESIIQVLVNIYFLWVVHAFMEEIKSGGSSSAQPQTV